MDIIKYLSVGKTKPEFFFITTKADNFLYLQTHFFRNGLITFLLQVTPYNSLSSQAQFY